MHNLYRRFCFLPLIMGAIVCMSVLLFSKPAYAESTLLITTDSGAWDSCAPHIAANRDQVGTGSYTSYATAWKEVSTGRLVYCASEAAHGGPATGQSGLYTYSHLASPQITWILDHGYPNTNVIGSQVLTNAEARLVTQAVLWNALYGEERFTFWYSDKMLLAYTYMVGAMQGHASMYESSNRYAIYAYTNTAARWQDVVVPYPALGSVTMVKKLTM